MKDHESKKGKFCIPSDDEGTGQSGAATLEQMTANDCDKSYRLPAVQIGVQR
jgi:hypothetical protein